MTLTGVKTKPTLRGTLVAAGPWQALIARQDRQVYPYQMGCAVRSASSGTTANTHGLGEFVQNDYFMVCNAVLYGDSSLYIPQTSKISKVTSDPSAAVDDQLTIDPAVTLAEGDFLLNLGADGASAPLSAPDYDGSLVTLYTDPVGNTANPNDYILTGQNGQFRGWIEGGYEVVDLLIADESGVPLIFIPSFQVGPEIL